MERNLFRSKLRAFGGHLLVSATVAAALVWVFMKKWFPMPYFVADGGWQGVRLIAAVDVVLGPVLSLVVYNPRKSRKALFLDYAVIGCFQLAAMGFGLWTVYTQRTALVVFGDGAFYTVTSDQMAFAGQAAAEIAAQSPLRPAYAYIHLPDDPEAVQEIRRQALATGVPVHLRAELMRVLDPKGLERIAARARDLERMVEGIEPYRHALEELLARTGANPRDLLFFPLYCRYRSLTIVFRRHEPVPFAWLPISFGPGGRMEPPGSRGSS